MFILSVTLAVPVLVQIAGKAFSHPVKMPVLVVGKNT
jgi:hypothetical protein